MGIKAAFVHCSFSVPCRAVLLPSLGEIEERGQRSGRQLLSDLPPLSEPSVWCWPDTLRALSISTYKYIHFSHLAFGESYCSLSNARREMGSESRLGAGQSCASDGCQRFIDGRGGEEGNTMGWILVGVL